MICPRSQFNLRKWMLRRKWMEKMMVWVMKMKMMGVVMVMAMQLSLMDELTGQISKNSRGLLS